MIKLKNTTFGYGNRKHPLFRSLNLEIQTGETVLITGINGSGKTTLLRLLAGALLPQSGSIEFSPQLGKNPRAKIGFISDRIRLYKDMTLAAALRYHSSVYSISHFDLSLIEKARLTLDKKINELSVGQQLIFHLNLILSTQPEILLIDEVIHSIDPYLRGIFINALLELMVQRQVTVVMVNLNYHDIENIPQRVILLRNGKIAVDEPIDQLKQKVKKVITGGELTAQFPILFSTAYGDMSEYYLYPFEDRFRETLEGTIKDLNLNDIIKAFIGGEYV